MPLAALAPALIIGGGAIAGAAISAGGAKSAANASQQATDQSIQLQRQQATDSAARLDPYVQAGYAGTNALKDRLGVGAPATSPVIDMAPDANGVFSSVPQQGGGAPGGNALTTQTGGAADPGTYGNPNPNFTDPGPYHAPAPYQAPAPYKAPDYTAPPAYTAPADFNFSIDDFTKNPAYQFALSQGSGQVLASNSATGALKSGAALKALQDRGQQTAYQFYAPERDFAYNQYTNNRDFGRNTYQDDRNFGRTTYENDRNFGQGAYQDARDFGYGTYNDDRNFGRAGYDTDRAFNYGSATDARNYLTGRADTQTNNLFRLSGIGADAASGVNAGNAASTTGIVNAIGTNAANQGGAAIAGSNATSSLLGSGMNALAYLYGKKAA